MGRALAGIFVFLVIVVVAAVVIPMVVRSVMGWKNKGEDN